jgi:maleamate amidohydrolase
MNRQFEDHCWKDVVESNVLNVYAHYERDTFIGTAPALLAIDLYELAYQGGARPVVEVAKTYPSSCGEYAWGAIPATQSLFAAVRRANLPVFYSTQDVQPASKPITLDATKRRKAPTSADAYDIKSEFEPQPRDVIIRKQRASVFYGTALVAYLNQLGVNTVIMCGESTSGCVRASVVDAYSHGFHVVVVEECCFDRYLLTHKINLFDLHHKYADVMHVEDVVSRLNQIDASRVG